MKQEEIRGTINILKRKIGELGEEGSPMTPYYTGFKCCMDVIDNAIEKEESIRYPKDFVKAFELMLEDL